MNLGDIANASLCVLDTNILLYAEQGYSHQAQRLLRRCSTGELTCILPQTVWHELNHRLMLAEAEMLGKVSGTIAARKLARHTEAIKRPAISTRKLRQRQNPKQALIKTRSSVEMEIGRV